MDNKQSRAEFLKNNPNARAWAALDLATRQQSSITSGSIKLKKDSHTGKTAVVIGSGVGGLTTAYELLSQQCGMEVIVLEAQNRTGGRCLSLRTGDTLTEDQDSELFNSTPGDTQVVRFERPLGDHEPYLNAGPGRIPSGHKHLLSYLKQFGVEVEVYVMNSGANLTQMQGGPNGCQPIAYRRLDHNTRGWLAQLIFENAEALIKSSNQCIANDKLEQRTNQLRDLMVSFGDLNSNGKYEVTAGEDGLENGKSRAGYSVLPGVDAGLIADALSFDSLLDSEFWKKTRFYQPVDFLWQPTLFQPVGGMDRVQHAFAQQVAAKGGTIHLNSPVKCIDWDEDKNKFIISVTKIGTEDVKIYEADYCFCNIAMPFLKNILSERLQGNEDKGFETAFKQALHSVYKAQFESPIDKGYVQRFLACTTKVGWQANRNLWQGSQIQESYNDSIGAEVMGIADSEVGVVPIFGGISWTDNQIQQIWYPSNDYHDQKGVLTGAYNFSLNAYNAGKESVSTRLTNAKKGAQLFGEAFATGLNHGVAIAWQNIPYIKGGWAQWHTVDDSTKHFNELVQGTCVDGDIYGAKFFIVGDQVSSLPGWQEGAITSALNAISRLANWEVKIPHISNLPDTRLMVEGI